jgi:1-acyl-sn-glycerol-3-phosphate acyltransferase
MHFIGFIAFLLYFLNLIIWFSLLVVTSLLRCVPYLKWRYFVRRLVERLPVYWIQGNTWIQQLTIPKTQWSVWIKSSSSLEKLSLNAWYLLVCNHQSWTDILVLQRIFNRRIPPLKFFLKKQLLWSLPIASWACWLLDFPFMRRYTHRQLLKQPALKYQDFETTRKACQKYQYFPTTVASFVEGTRFTPLKHQRQQAPYQHLLYPKSGGVAFSLAVLGRYFDTLLNVTLIYPQGKVSLWDFLCGRLKQIEVYIETLPVGSKLVGDYYHDRGFRVNFQRWLNQLWHEKDRVIQSSRLEKLTDWTLLTSYQQQTAMIYSYFIANRSNFMYKCTCLLSSILVSFAVIVGIVACKQLMDGDTIMAITRFFEIVIPILAIGALIKYLFTATTLCKGCHTKITNSTTKKL